MLVTEREPGDLDDLRRRVRRESSAAQRDRYRVVLLALEGHETKAMPAAVGSCNAGSTPTVKVVSGRSWRVNPLVRQPSSRHNKNRNSSTVC